MIDLSTKSKKVEALVRLNAQVSARAIEDIKRSNGQIPKAVKLSKPKK
jgi:hypothetical protein